MSITSPRFSFFDREILKDPELEGHNFDKFKELDITCSTAGRGQILVGDRDGTVVILDKLLNMTAFRAHNISISHIHQLRQNTVLLTVGTDEDTEYPQLKVWQMDRVDSNGRPHCSRIIKLSATGGHAEVSCIAVHENMQLLAVGYKSGVVTLYKGDVSKERQSKLFVVRDSEDDRGGEITGLAIRIVLKSQLLFVTTRNALFAYEIAVKDKFPQVLKENYGCTLKCSALADDLLSNQFLIGRNDGVYYMQPEGRGGTAPLEGEKYQVHWYRGYIVTVGRSSINRDMDIVTIYDSRNKFIAYSGAIPKVSNVLFEWNAIYILGGENKMYILLEKDTKTKLEILFKKNQYITAINIAKSQKYDTHGLVDIFRLYGDYLYTERGDHDQAIEQYKMTIGKLEPSYVIRKFLDAQRLHNLTSYLEELHNKHHATEDHTTLLLNCYTKLKDQDKLDEFIHKKDRNNEVYFDVETAIRVLRQADYHSHALQLAERHSQHEWYMKIQLENVKDFPAALRYVQKLPFHEAESSLKKYGKVLIQALPSETTRLLKRLCLGEYSTTARARPDEFIHIFVNNSQQLTGFLEAMIASEQTPDAAVIYNTLLELYLQTWAKLDPKSQPTERVEQSEKVMKLLKESTMYAKDQALVLCQLYRFDKGILHLYEQGRLYQQVVRYHMDHNDYDEVIASCKRWGQDDPHVWVMALSYFAGKEDDLKLQMKEVLANIDEQKLLPPLLVIQTLANSKVCTLGVVKSFIMDRLLKENEKIEDEERLIREYVEETQKLRQKIHDLKNKPQVFQTSKCCVCKYQLELPSVHFLCQHSYHTPCFDSYAENENECPVCLEDNRKMLEVIRQHERSKDVNLTAAFAKDLKQEKDGFNVIAQYFGKGIFNEVSLVSDSTGSSTPAADIDYPYKSSSANIKAGNRRNPFSGGGGDLGRSEGFGSATVDSSFPIHKEANPSGRPATGASSYSHSVAATTGSSKPGTIAHSSLQSAHRGGSGMADTDSVSTRSKQRPTDSSRPAAAPISKPHSDSFVLSRDSGPNVVSRDILKSSGRSTALPVISVTPAKTVAHEEVTKSASATQKFSSSPSQSLGTSAGKKGRSGHSRQSSAGKIIESGLSFIKGHKRQSSDQSNRKHAGNLAAAAKPFEDSKSKSKEPLNPFEDAPSSSHRRQQSSRTSSNPFEAEASSNTFEKPKAKESSNPFEKPKAKESSNPFEKPKAKESFNPFEDEPDSHSAPANPFLEEGSNPFESENTNPFE